MPSTVNAQQMFGIIVSVALNGRKGSDPFLKVVEFLVGSTQNAWGRNKMYE